MKQEQAVSFGAMATRAIGDRIKRNEDPRLLRGRGRYVADVRLPGMLHAAILRSPHGHARIRSLDLSPARAADGVALVCAADDLGELNQPSPLLIPHPSLTHPRTQLPLARDEVRYVGEAVALAVAETRELAEDALELIEVDYEPLPVCSDVRAALDPGAALVHADVPGNLAAHFVQRVGDPERAFAEAAHVFEEGLWMERSAGQPLETRGVVAQFDPSSRSLVAYISTQAPLALARGLANMLELPEHNVRVIAPDVGGGFGTKIMLFYPEEVLIPWAAVKLGRPVRWIEDRREHFISANQERGQAHRAAIAVDERGVILGVRDSFVHDTGAYTPYGIVVGLITASQLPGPYRIRNYLSELRVAYTNTVPVSPYRGAGRPHGVFVMERLIGRIARELGLEPAEVRRRNLIGPDEFPWDVGITFQDGGPTRYDSGDYPALLDRLLAGFDYDGARSEQAAARRASRYVGLGLGCYVEGTGIGPYEGAHVRVEPSGQVLVASGLTTQGQGHYTSFAQIAAAELGVDVRRVTVITGDSAAFNWGAGTYASRALVVAGNAVGLAARSVAEKARRLAAGLLEVAPDDLELVDGTVRVRGAPERALPLAGLATVADPIRYAYGKASAEMALKLAKPRAGAALPAGEEPGLEARRYYSPEQSTFAAGAHAALVEVDPSTGQLTILRYAIAHDCGTLINPLIVEGQIAGGVAQGLGGSFYERLAYDAHGQLTTASYMDFLIPTSAEVPPVGMTHLETPSPLNPLGVKGVGEAGAIPVPAVLAEAIEDALAPLGVGITEMPLDPSRLRELIRSRRSVVPATIRADPAASGRMISDSTPLIREDRER